MTAAREPDLLSLRVWAQEAEAAAGIAKALAPTAFVPDSLRVYTNPQEREPWKRIQDLDGTVAQVTAVLLAGQELKLPPMASLRSFTIIKGTVAMYALAARALLLHNGHEVVVVESTSTRAIVRGRRAGEEHWQTSTWDLDRAKTAGLYPGHPDGNWRKQTKSMLVARATAEASRWVAADALLGLPVFVEEIETEPNGQAGPLAIEAGPAEPKTTTKRKTPARRAALPAAPVPVADPPAPVPEEPERPRPHLTVKQRNRIHAGLRDLGVATREEGFALLAAWVSTPEEVVTVTSTNDLTPEQAVIAIERLDALLTARAQGDPLAEHHEPDEPPDPEEPPGDAEPD